MSNVKNYWWEDITSEDYTYSPDWEYATSVNTTPIFDDEQLTFNFKQPKKLGIDIQKKVDKICKDANISIVNDDSIPF